MSHSANLSYCIDSHDILKAVDESWILFARGSGQPDLSISENLIGRSLWDFVATEGVRTVYQSVLKFVRERNEEINIPFRCDAPETMRLMDLRCSPKSNGGVIFRTTTIEEKKTEYRRFLAERIYFGEKPIDMCSWCMAVRISRLKWVPLEEGIRHYNFFDLVPGPVIEHGVCPRCFENILSRVDPGKWVSRG